ncbi:MAG: 16S rRNA (cytidine(1402)-2'-O)-methyltransferase [Pseudomonadales bacterium]|nr:16S rRNA (cytidine(1402)-2'-O)-methyltransferase [Pseudomonadales bacterium]
MATGILYIVATPIGNLNDITLRALEVLRQVAVIAAEDTRHSKKLLDHYGIETPLMSVHDHNEADQVGALQTRLQNGESVALISDAGTPLISDPGFRVVRALQQAEVEVVAVPGPCAAIAALSIAGLPTDRFLFVGFLPTKQQARRSALEALLQERGTLVLYESPKRIKSTLEDVASVLGQQREVAVVKEITKAYETVRRGAALDVLDWLQQDQHHCRGEFVLLVAGAPESLPAIDPAALRALRLAAEYMPLKKACGVVAEITGLPKNALYEAALADNADKA